MIYDADSGYVRRKYDKKCIGLMILGSVSAIVSVLITMWLCRPRTTITEITEKIYIQQVVTERVTTRVNVTDDKTAHDDSGATYVIAFETESASIEIEFNYLAPFKRNMHRFRQIALMGRGLGYDGSWGDEITPRDADVEWRVWKTLPKREEAQARPGQIGFRYDFANITNMFELMIVRQVPDERDIQHLMFHPFGQLKPGGEESLERMIESSKNGTDIQVKSVYRQ